MGCVNRVIKSLDTLVADQEAYYARRELLDFIGYAKYANTPRNLAQAMAGLPHIGCWHSFQKCEKEPSPLWPMRPEEIPPLSYRAFLLIEECCGQENRETNGTLMELLRERIRATPQTSDLRGYLAQHVRYLRQAVDETDLRHIPSAAAPYRIFAAFMKHIAMPRSGEESTLAEIEQRQI
jgi:hypothetical protein